MSDRRAQDIEDAIAEVDARVAETVRGLAAKWREMGYRTDELPVVMRPMLDQLAEIRARQLAEIDALFAANMTYPPPALH